MDFSSLFASMGVPPPNPNTCDNTGFNNNWLIIIIALFIIFFFRKNAFGTPSFANYTCTSCKKRHRCHHKHEDAYMPPFEPFTNGMPNNILPIILVVFLLVLVLQKKPNIVPV
jgi:hypothetical protein